MENTSAVRRRTNRTARESTPEPTTKLIRVGSERKARSATDGGDEDINTVYVVKGILNVGGSGATSPTGSISSSSSSSGNGGRSSGSHAYRAKILSKKEKSMADAVHRSQSTSRQSASCQTNNDIFTYLRRAKRSLSAPRKREGSVESGKLTPQMQEMKISMLENENYELSNKSDDDNSPRNLLLEQNLKRFEEERRQFELERLKFLEEKRELDRIRLQRFERYKRELEARRLGIKPNYDIDNPNDYMVARKVVIDYNEKLQQQQQENASDDSEPEEVTVVENVPKKQETEEIKVDENELNVKATANSAESEQQQKHEDRQDNSITDHTNSGSESTNQNHMNGKELLNGTEKSPTIEPPVEEMQLKKIEFDEANPMSLWPFTKLLLRECGQIWHIHIHRHSVEWRCLKREILLCVSELLMLMMYCGMGGIIFRYIEGNFEMLNKTGVKRVKRDFIDQLWLSSHNLREDDWKSMARMRLRKFEEELQAAIEGGMNTYSGHTTWSFVNAVIYCLDISTTIGYGHISPRTVSGRILTIVYAIIGIPIFLILLADFGKLFTRIIKFVWVFVRRLYYTGSCRKVRKTAQAQDVMRGLNVMYDFMRRPSMAFDPNVLHEVQQQNQQQTLNIPPGESPMTPLPVELENYEIDDEFNLPISLAIILLISYMLCGAILYCIMEEEWTFFEAFYFVFISISTIGFGDFVPSRPLYMMASIFYLIFGLALTSMCINVVQVKLSDHFKTASSKIIGLQIAEATSQNSAPHSPTSDLQSVHSIDNSGMSIQQKQQPLQPSVIISDNNTKNTNSKML